LATPYFPGLDFQGQAIWMTDLSVGMGWFNSGWAGLALRKLPAPGSKKSRGETLLVTLKPPQPAPKTRSANTGAHRTNFLIGLMVRTGIFGNLFGNLLMKTRRKLEVARIVDRG
jgi:hypothetical protein